MTSLPPNDSNVSIHASHNKTAGNRRRANFWLTALTTIVVAAQVLAGCGPAQTRGAAGGMDASLLDNARQFGAVPPLNMSNVQPLAMSGHPVMTNVVPEALQSVVNLDSVDPDALAQIDPNHVDPDLASAENAAATENLDTTGNFGTAENLDTPENQEDGDTETTSEVAAEPVTEAAVAPEAAAESSEPATMEEAASGDAPSTAGDTSVAAEPTLLVQTPAISAPITGNATTTRTGALQPQTPMLDKTTNILVMGSDRREGAPNWLTDVMMIVALDYENGRAGVISLPRDIYLDHIPNHQPNKMNVVDYLGEQDREGGGGPELLSNIIMEKMGVRIDHYVRFDFRGFIALVDALGGVEVEIDCPYYDYFSIENVILNVKPGIERLSGDEALVYVRSRKIGGDLDRARRQQRFVWAVRNQVLNENILPKLPSLYNAVSESVQTDIGIVATIRIARFAMNLDKEDITGFVIGYPLVEQGYAGGMWVFKADWDAIRAEVQNVFTRPPFIDTNTLAECP